jgi:tetratricopeptide (TPR) repeat protein
MKHRKLDSKEVESLVDQMIEQAVFYVPKSDMALPSDGRLVARSFEVTYEPIEGQWPPEVERLLPDLRRRVTRPDERLLAELEQLIGQFPTAGILKNLLVSAYGVLGRIEQAEAWSARAFAEHPDYLFARLNYVGLKLARGNFEEASKALSTGGDLIALCGGRDRFHVSEVVAYFGLLGEYRLRVGQRRAATVCYRILCDVDADDARTRRLRSLLAQDFLDHHMPRFKGESAVQKAALSAEATIQEVL